MLRSFFKFGMLLYYLIRFGILHLYTFTQFHTDVDLLIYYIKTLNPLFSR